MKIHLSLLLIALTTFTNVLPQPVDTQPQSQSQSRHVVAIEGRRPNKDISLPASEELWKRKGGGGGGGKGGGSGGSSSGGGGSGRGSGSSTSGGRTTTGSGVAPSYGRGYYGGGAAVPYASGGRSASGISPLLFVGAGAFAVFPALWLYSVYSYPYSRPYNFRNQTSNRNETKPVNCLCEEYSECGCDENGDNSHLDALVGSGDYRTLNKSVVTVADINGTSTILLNGTLPNGTTASGGTDDPDDSNGAVSLEFSGYWLMIALVGCTVFFT